MTAMHSWVGRQRRGPVMCMSMSVVTHHAALLVIVLPKAQRQIRQCLRAALHRHGLVVGEAVLLHTHQMQYHSARVW